MREIMNEVLPSFNLGKPFVLATVTRTWSSAPRPVGAAMALLDSGEVIGSVSGGCVEGAIHEVSLEVMKTRQSQSVTYGVSDDNAFAVGLTCGGTIELFIQYIDSATFPEFADIASHIEQEQAVGVATLIYSEGGIGARIILTKSDANGTLGNSQLDHAAIEGARALLKHGTTKTLKLGPNGENRMDDVSVFVESFAPAPRMIIFGAIDFAAAVARIGKFMGYYVIVCDARALFATKRRFPDADEVIIDWPHRYLPKVEVDETTVICVLTHDPKFDVPVLEIALRTSAGYVGAMGSRRTHEDRLVRLREIGMTEAEISKLKSPIGLDLGGRTPEETAISIAAEIISNQVGGTNQPLTSGIESIHKISLASESEPAPVIK
ncbi:MAG: XdhC family protein [Candidatus Planktophila sp.]|jgi:xanthine dehydrogenase accessory factor|tara:strand:- start:5752 stop:6888 length:1137 start_codon:yes stop_codon:yes gene_type:complete